MTTSNEHNNAPAVPQGRPFGHFRAEPFGWTDCAATDDGAIALYEHPMTNPWRDAVIEQLESWHIYVPAIHDNSPRLAIKALVNMECKAALDPAVSSEAAALAAQGVQAPAPAVPQGWRDFLTELSKQKPEKPDYWSSCGQCERNSSTAEDLIAATKSTVPAQEPAPTWSLREALQKAKDALSLALSDVDWRKDSPTQPVIHKAYNCAHQALALPTAEQVDDINVAESFTSVTKTAAPAQEVASAFTTALDIRLAQGWNLTGNAIPVLYTDTINDYQVRRDDVWLCTTDALKTKQEVGLTASQFDLICQAIVALDTGTITMEGDYMLDSDDCIGVVRVMQVLFDIAALRAKGGKHV